MTFDDATNAIGEVLDVPLLQQYGLQHLSYSSLSLLDLCSSKWRYRYIEKWPSQKDLPMAIGSGVHRGIEFYHLGKTEEEQLEAAKKKLAKEAPEDALLPPAEASIERMLNAYRHEYAQEATAAEIENEVDFGGISIMAITDVIQEGTAADIKSTTKQRSRFTPDPLQLFLNLLVLHANNMTLDKAEVRPIRRDVTGSRSPIVLEPFTFDANPGFIKAQTAETIRRIKDLQARLSSGLWDKPAHEKMWACSYCPYANDCELLRAPVRFAAA